MRTVKSKTELKNSCSSLQIRVGTSMNQSVTVRWGIIKERYAWYGRKKYFKWYNKVGYGSGDIAGNVVYRHL